MEPHADRARGVIAIGASAGGVEALQRVVRGLPETLPAAVCIVLHISATSRSVLADIIARVTDLPVEVAEDGHRLWAGHVYVAPPDRHLLVEAGRLALDRGPKENAVRPAIDPLFRSAAGAYGRRAMGIVLSGALSDGSVGLAQLVAAGGTALVQDPDDALVPSMPAAALVTTPEARTLRADELGDAIAAFADTLSIAEEEEERAVAHESGETPIERSRRTPPGPPTGFTCPECHGPLWEVGQNRFRCRVGHVYNEDLLVHAKDDEVEAALWAALEALEERADLMERIAVRVHAGGAAGSAARYRARRDAALRRADLLRTHLLAGEEPTEATAG